MQEEDLSVVASAARRVAREAILVDVADNVSRVLATTSVLGFTETTELIDGTETLVAAGAGCVAVTRDSKGALVVTNNDVVETTVYDVDVVDTSGRGDAFSAEFLRGRSLGSDLCGSGELGYATAAQVAGGLGTGAENYSLERVREFSENTLVLE
ncbi:PfkB family carbohydrate kinase [Nocardia sp. CA-135398]|uniref:PfkB family carbohydrate kinase n=1 Tax=Nocardia sp. CA-135398 TaxID=3239977 RepID=UPI003D968AA3